MEFLSDYEIQPDGLVFVEFDGEYGRHRHFLPPAEADVMVARNQAYNDANPAEVEAYERQMQEDMDMMRIEDELANREWYERAELEHQLDHEAYIASLEKQATRRAKRLTSRTKFRILEY